MTHEPCGDGDGPEKPTPPDPPPCPGISLDGDAARERLISRHGEVLARTLDCAAGVAAAFETTVDGRPASERSRTVRGNLGAALDRTGLRDVYAELLPDLVAAAGGTMTTTPVAGPPYVAVTSTGPVLRATLDGGRLVVRIEVFVVDNGTFVWQDPSPGNAVRVEVRG